jgi:hypothetical protein
MIGIPVCTLSAYIVLQCALVFPCLGLALVADAIDGILVVSLVGAKIVIECASKVIKLTSFSVVVHHEAAAILRSTSRRVLDGRL